MPRTASLCRVGLMHTVYYFKYCFIYCSTCDFLQRSLLNLCNLAAHSRLLGRCACLSQLPIHLPLLRTVQTACTCTAVQRVRSKGLTCNFAMLQARLAQTQSERARLNTRATTAERDSASATSDLASQDLGQSHLAPVVQFSSQWQRCYAGEIGSNSS